MPSSPSASLPANDQGGRVVGHGVDVVDLNDFSRMLRPPADAFLNRIFRPTELVDEDGRPFDPHRIATRFAVKESVLKALGTGWGDGIAFTDVEVVTRANGAPDVILHRTLEKMAQSRGICRWAISASHSKSAAFASAIALT